MKIYFNRKLRRDPWGGGAHFHSSMFDYLLEKGHHVVNKLENNIDVIFMLDPRYELEGCDYLAIKNYKIKNPNTKILFRINECDLRKNTNEIDNLIIEGCKISDKIIFISEWLQNYFQKNNLKCESKVIYNGCNQKWFYPEKNKKINRNFIRLVTHHWSDNWLKGFELYTQLDKFLSKNKNFSFTYIGRYNKNFSPQNTKIIKPLYGKELGDELRKYDIYVTGSQNEPCGMHHIEGASSGMPVLYHFNGGAIADICKNHGEGFYNFQDFLLSLEKIINNYDFYINKIDYNILNIQSCCEEYYKSIMEMIKT